MSTERETIVRRVSKLLSLASDNPSEAEAQAAAVKAQELMLGEAITMADVARYENETGVRTARLEAGHVEYYCDPGHANLRTVTRYGYKRGAGYGYHEYTRATGKRVSWRGMLAFKVAKYMGGKAVITYSTGTKSKGDYVLGKVTFIGLNVDTIVEVYRYLELQLDVLSAQEMRDRPSIERFNYSTGEYEYVKPNGRYWRLSWLAGAVERVSEMLRVQYEKVEETSGTELVLVRDLVKEKMAELFPEGTSPVGNGLKSYDGNAYRRGFDQAGNVDIGRSKLNTPPAQIGS